jgi:hypothetical protein
MPMTPASNAAQEQIWETCIGFHAVQMAGTWTMQVSVNVSDGDDYTETVEHSDYNEALLALKAKLDEHA